MTKALMLFALGTVQRLVPDSETRQIEEITAGTVFEAADQAEVDNLIRLNGARQATNDEITIEKERVEREGTATRSTILASAGTVGQKPVAERDTTTGSAPAKKGSAKGSGSSADPNAIL